MGSSQACFRKQSNYRWKRKVQGCLNSLKHYKYLGHYITPKSFEKISETVLWCKKDFEKHGFKIHMDEDDKFLYFYADKADYPYPKEKFKSAAWMCGVSFTRQLEDNSTQAFFYLYKRLREFGFSMCETMFIFSYARSSNVIGFVLSANQIPREKPNLKSTYRQSGSSVFFKSSNKRHYFARGDSPQQKQEIRELKCLKSDMINKITSIYPKKHSHKKIENITDEQLKELKPLIKKYSEKW